MAGSFKRLQAVDKATFKFRASDTFEWVQPPRKGQLQMITQDIYDYLASATSSENEFAAITGLVIDRGAFVQLLGDGMVLFHDLDTKSLVRVLGSHWDSVNDLAIQEYQDSQQVSFVTCSTDNTLRLWSSSLSHEPDRQSPVDSDLKRILYVDYEEQIGKSSVVGRVSSEESGVKCMDLSAFRSHLAVGDMAGNIRVYSLEDVEIRQVNFIEAHEAKVVALRYSQGYSAHLLASASADRMVHIFNAGGEDYELMQTIDAHGTSIVDLQFAVVVIGVQNKHKVT